MSRITPPSLASNGFYGAVQLLRILASGTNPDGTPFSLPVVEQGQLVPVGYQQLTGIASSTPLTIPSGATLARFQAEAQAVRWRPDGQAPTATAGMLLAAGNEEFYNSDLTQLHFIQASAGAILNVAYFGPATS